MLVHAIAPKRFFSQTPNDIIRHPRLNGTAVRLLQWALSLPEGARETIQSIGEKMPEGRVAVRRARAQLETEGFLHTRRRQNPETGRWTTQVLVSNVALTTAAEIEAAFAPAAPAVPAAPPGGRMPTVGEPAVQAVGASPKGENTEENTSHPESHREPPPLVGRAAKLLQGLGHREAKLRLGLADAARLAPLAARWFAHGASELELRMALTSGLPPAVHSPAGLLAHRLRDKLPAPRTAVDPAAPARPLPECAHCGNPLPPAQTTGICTHCTGSAPTPAPPVRGPALARAAYTRARSSLTTERLGAGVAPPGGFGEVPTATAGDPLSPAYGRSPLAPWHSARADPGAAW